MDNASKAKRKKEIAKAIDLIGWIDTSERLKAKEDKQIFSELSKEFNAHHDAEQDKKLQKAGILL